MNLKLKICGMKFPDNIREVIKYRPDYLGFIFYPGSPRYAGDNMEELSTLDITPSIKITGVFVNESTDKIQQIASSISLDMVQLHGQEPVADCIELRRSGLKVVKVFSVGEDFDFGLMEPYVNDVNYFLFDT
ncbi:MAG: phosphoribosylanthranilate isomerase, partial [Cyclobacteriaceae bacterium]